MSTKTDGGSSEETGATGPANVTGENNPSAAQDAAAGGGGAGGGGGDDKSEDAKKEDKGDPVNVVKGTVVEDTLDLSLPGLISFEWRRRYSSGSFAKQTPLGRGGWTHDWHQWIEPEGEGWLLRNNEGADLSFGAIPQEGAALHRGRRFLLRRRGAKFELFELESRRTRVFEAFSSGGPAWLRSIADAYGNRITLHYQSQGLSRIVDTAGREVVLERDDEGRITAVDVVVSSSPLQGPSSATYRVATYGYSPEGELAWAADALGRAIRYEYDGKHRIIRKELRNGFAVHYEYHPDHGRVVRTYGDGGYHQVGFTYDFDKRTTTTHSEPQPRVYHWDAKDNILREETFDGRHVIERKWDSDHHLLSVKNAAGEESTFEYDARGFLVKHTDPAGNVTLREHVDDLLRKVTLPNGNARTFEYDGYGGLWSITTETGARYSVDRDSRGRVVAIYGPNGLIEKRTYDERHLLTSVKGAQNQTTTYEYDDLGRPTRRTDPLGHTTTLTYDAADQVTSVERPDKTVVHFEYDGVGQVTRIRKPGGDVLMRYVATGVLAHAVMEDGGEWHLDYDREEKPVRVRNPKGEAYEFVYDRAGRVIEERTFDGRSIKYGYDLAGEIQRIDQPDGSFRAFAYDPLGNLLEETSTHGPIFYKRDPQGRLLEARLEEGPVTSTVQFDRDAFGRVIAESQDGQTIHYRYDTEGRVLARALPNGEVTHYQYDLDGMLAAVKHGDQEVTFSRDQVGQERQRHLKGSPVAIASSYDAMGRLVSQQAVSPADNGAPGPLRGPLPHTPAAPEGAAALSALLKRSWKYDEVGRPVRIEDDRWGATDYFYDRAHNLVRAQRGSLDEAFEYDPAGCLVRAFSGIQAAGDRWSTASGDVLRRSDSATYEVDASRRRTKKIELTNGKPTDRVTEYIWDCRDRLREVRLPSGEVVRYFYDAFGRRTRKVVFPPPPTKEALAAPLPKVVRFLWDGDVLAAETSTETGTRTFVHEPGTFSPLLQSEQGEVFLYVLDQVGTPRELIDTKGRVAWAASYKAWGQIDKAQGDKAERARAVSSPFRLLGQYADEETGLHCTRFRYWDPEVGRWLSPDPLGILGGTRLFAFDGASTTHMDPWGLDTEKAKRAAALREKMLKALEEQTGMSRQEILKEHEIFLHGTSTSALQDGHFVLNPNGKFFTTHQITTAEHFAGRTVNKYGGEPTLVAFLVPRDAMRHMPPQTPIGDRPGMREHIHRPASALDRWGDGPYVLPGVF